jgi:DNA polymerase II small subunit
MNYLHLFLSKGKRVSVEAEQSLAELSEEEIHYLLSLDKVFINKEDVLAVKRRVKVVVKRAKARVEAEEYDGDVEVLHEKDVTGKSRGKGKVEDFVQYFQARFKRMKRLFQPSSKQTLFVEDIKKGRDMDGRIVCMVYDIRESKRGNLLFEIEDLTGNALAVVPKNNEVLYNKAREVLKDEVIALSGRVRNGLFVVDDVEWPNIPIRNSVNVGRRHLDLYAVYISDIHFGSKQFLSRLLDKFVDWLWGRTKEKNVFGKVKYVVIAGDVVDGIGIYPGQEHNLEVLDLEKQYAMFDEFVQRLPAHIDVIVAPGNHDGVRRAEPMPAIASDLITSDVIRVGNPAHLKIEGLYHLLYHGTSMFSLLPYLPRLSEEKPEDIMVEFLKRRHLSPIYGENLIVPELVDYFVIDEVPDVFHAGHIHIHGYSLFRGVHVINSATFQDQTDLQKERGIIPTPGKVSLISFKTGQHFVLDLNTL